MVRRRVAFYNEQLKQCRDENRLADAVEYQLRIIELKWVLNE